MTLPTNYSRSSPDPAGALNATNAAVNGLADALAVEVGTNAANFGSLAAAVVAAPAGGVVRVPAGTFSVSSLLIDKDLTFVGDGSSISIIDAGANAGGFSPPSTGSGARIAFHNIGFTGSTSAIFTLSRAFTFSARFIDCRFSGFTASAIATFGTNVTCVRCEFTSDGTPGAKAGINHFRGAQSITLRDCTFRFLNRGLYCTDTDGPAENVSITGCTFDGGWMYLKSTASNSGGTITYGTTSLTDTAAAFGTLVAGSTVRALAAKRAGTFTAVSNTKLTDSAANFTTAAVLKGDIIRTSTGWGVVDEVVSTTILKIEEWINSSTYGAMPAPAASTAYTIYGLVLGKVASNTGTVVTVDAWRDWNGTIATPASGTLYELAPKSDYQCFILRAGHATVTGNTFRRGWADQIAPLNCRNAIIADNQIYDGQDVGITIQGSGAYGQSAVVTGNRIVHQGTAGIWCSAPDAVINANSITDPNWTSLTSATYGGITLDTGADRAQLGLNIIKRVNHPSALKAISLLGTTTGVRLLDNSTVGYTTQDIMITGSGVTAVTGRFQKGTVITLVSSAVAPVGDFTGAGTPESVVAGGVGSMFHRTDGGAGTCLYVKETGTGNTGWVAK